VIRLLEDFIEEFRRFSKVERPPKEVLEGFSPSLG